MLLFFESFYKTFFNLLSFTVICFIVTYNDYKYIAVCKTRCAEKLDDILYIYAQKTLLIEKQMNYQFDAGIHLFLHTLFYNNLTSQQYSQSVPEHKSHVQYFQQVYLLKLLYPVRSLRLLHSLSAE